MMIYEESATCAAVEQFKGRVEHALAEAHSTEVAALAGIWTKHRDLIELAWSQDYLNTVNRFHVDSMDDA